MNKHLSALMLIAVLAVTVFIVSQNKSPNSANKKKITPKKPQLKKESRIERIERLFVEWGDKLILRIPKHVHHPRIREQLKVPFDYMKRNRKTKIKLYVDYSKKNPGHTIVDRNFFYYQFRDFGSRRIAASYNEGKRTISLSHDFNPKSTYDMLVLYHEIMHATQGDALAKMLNKDQYRYYARNIAPYGNLVGFEVQAYAWEIEILNIVVDGHLAKVFRKGGTLDVLQYMKQLNIPDSQRAQFASLVKYANMYYPEGFMTNGFSRKFDSFVVSMLRYARPGVRLYRLTKNGNFIALR